MGWYPLGDGFLTQFDDFGKESLLRSQPSSQPANQPASLDENIVKTIGICTFGVTLFEMDPSQKHKKMNKSLTGRAHSLLKSIIPNGILVPPHPHPQGGERGHPPTWGSPPGSRRGSRGHMWVHWAQDRAHLDSVGLGAFGPIVPVIPGPLGTLGRNLNLLV